MKRALLLVFLTGCGPTLPGPCSTTWVEIEGTLRLRAWLPTDVPTARIPFTVTGEACVVEAVSDSPWLEAAIEGSELVVTADPSVYFSLLLAGRAALMTASSDGDVPALARVAEPRGRQVHFSAFSDWGYDVLGYFLVTRADRIAREPDKVRAFADATVRAVRFALDRPDEAATIMVRRNPTLDRGATLAHWRRLVKEGVREGERNTSVASLAGHLLWHGLDPTVVLDLLLSWNATRCRPPLPEDEVARTVESIMRLHESHEAAEPQARPKTPSGGPCSRYQRFASCQPRPMATSRSSSRRLAAE